MKRIGRALSDKIKIAGFLCALMVVLRHSLNLYAFWGTEDVENVCGVIEHGFSRLTEIAVPYFFIISGYFFYRTCYYGGQTYWGVLKRKAFSLGVPFILWNFIGLIPLLLYKPSDVEFGFCGIMKGLLLSEWYGPLWYVRNTIIMMVLYPFYGWLLRQKNVWLHVILVLILFLLWVPVDCSIYSTEGWLFFILGCLLNNYGASLKSVIKWWYIGPLLLVWLYLCFLNPSLHQCFHKFITLLGLCLFWSILDYFPQVINRFILRYASMAFFIYVTHFYIVKGMKVFLASCFPQSEIVALSSYFMLPVLAVFVSCFVGYLWMRFHPKSYNIAVGGRS